MKTNELQLVTFEQAKKLKELGFGWQCYACYIFEGVLEEYEYFDNFNHPTNKVFEMDCEESSEAWSAPTVALALKWFRDVKRYNSGVVPIGYGDFYFIIEFLSYDLDGDDYEYIEYFENTFSTYEQAESELLDELLKIIEQ